MSNTWLNSEIRWLIQYRFGKETKEDVDNSIDKNLKILVYREIPRSVQQVQGNNTVLESELDSTTSIMIEVDQPVSDFIDQYIAKVLFRVDIKRRHIWALEGKISPKIPTHAKIDNKDIISPDNTESKPLNCPYCPAVFTTAESHALHVVRYHPGHPPDPTSNELPEEFDFGFKTKEIEE